MCSSTTAERQSLASRDRTCCLRRCLPARPLRYYGFRGSTAHPTQSLCTLRTRRRRRPRNTRYRAPATAYPDRSLTGRTTPAYLAHKQSRALHLMKTVLPRRGACHRARVRATRWLLGRNSELRHGFSMCCEENAAGLLFTSPTGRGRRAAPGEGIRSIDTPKPLTRIASDDAIRPLPAGEVTNRPFHPSGSAKGRYQTRNDENAVSYAASVTPPVMRRLAARSASRALRNSWPSSGLKRWVAAKNR